MAASCCHIWGLLISFLWSKVTLLPGKIFLPADASQRLSGQHQFKKPVVPRQCLSTCCHGPFFCPWKFVIAMISHWQWRLAQTLITAAAMYIMRFWSPTHFIISGLESLSHVTSGDLIRYVCVLLLRNLLIRFTLLLYFLSLHWLFEKLIFVCCKLELCTLLVTNGILNSPHMSGCTCLYLFCFYAGIRGKEKMRIGLSSLGEELADTVLAVLALMISLLLIAFSEMSMVIISTIAY